MRNGLTTLVHPATTVPSLEDLASTRAARDLARVELVDHDAAVRAAIRMMQSADMANVDAGRDFLRVSVANALYSPREVVA